MIRWIYAFLKNTDGAAAIEYGLIVSLIAVAIIPGAISVGVKLTSTFEKVSSHL